jgi:hypothetical protein
VPSKWTVLGAAGTVQVVDQLSACLQEALSSNPSTAASPSDNPNGSLLTYSSSSHGTVTFPLYLPIIILMMYSHA